MIPVFVSRLSRLEQYTCFNSSVYGAAGLKQGKSISDLEHFAIEMLYGVEKARLSAAVEPSGDVPVPGLEHFHIENALPTA